MDITTTLKAIESTGLAAGIRDSLYAFPLIESFHVIGLTMTFGTIAIVDFRPLGLASAHRPFTKVAEILKWTWVAFGLTVITGALMFITNASVYFSNLQFRWKMVLIALSGINMFIFDRTCGRNVSRWENDNAAPPSGKLAAAWQSWRPNPRGFRSDAAPPKAPRTSAIFSPPRRTGSETARPAVRRR